MKVNKIYEKIVNSRKDFIEKLSTKIVKENDVVVIESLKIQSMAQSKLKLGKSVNDTAYGLFVSRLEQKMAVTPKLLIKADQWFASSQTCSICGYCNKDLTLQEREWECPLCHSHLLRDQNAAQNLVKYGTNLIKDTGRGPSVELVEAVTVVAPLKQEAAYQTTVHGGNKGDNS